MFCDDDWASDPDDRRNTFGAMIYFGANLIYWWSKKQHLIARSNTKAKYRSLAQVTTDLLWIQTLLQELGVSTKSVMILVITNSYVMLAQPYHALQDQTYEN